MEFLEVHIIYFVHNHTISNFFEFMLHYNLKEKGIQDFRIIFINLLHQTYKNLLKCYCVHIFNCSFRKYF